MASRMVKKKKKNKVKKFSLTPRELLQIKNAVSVLSQFVRPPK